MKKKICYLDMDGVLANFDKTLFAMHPEVLNYPLGSDQRKQVIDSFCQSDAGRRIFLNLEPIDDAIESFNLLYEHYELYMLSTPMWGLPESYSDKRIWVERVLGSHAEKRLILSHHKNLLKGHYIIDDRVKHGVDKFEGEHIHFGQSGFETWKKVIAYLRKKDNW